MAPLIVGTWVARLATMNTKSLATIDLKSLDVVVGGINWNIKYKTYWDTDGNRIRAQIWTPK